MSAVPKTVGPISELRGDLHLPSAPPFELLSSSALRRVRKLIEHDAAGDLPVLITGEVGAGKELVAREIHRRSARATRPLMKLNCAALGLDFFDPASSTVERLKGSTLLLDDIGELPLLLQERLLQLLRDSDLRQGELGSGGPSLRVIAVTHHDLNRALEAGTFGEELFYRINMVHVHVPPLREHAEDIPALVQHFARLHALPNAPLLEIPAALLERFQSHSWPGNIRQLENAVRRLIALSDPDYVLEELEVFGAAVSPSTSPPSLHASADDYVDLKEIGRRAAESAEREAIIAMLGRTLGNKKEAAQRLGISYKALLYKMRDFGITRARNEHAGNGADRHSERPEPPNSNA